MSKINLNLDLNPETPFNQSQADALSSLIYAYSTGETAVVITGKTIAETAVAVDNSTTDTPVVDKPKTSRNRAANKPKNEEAASEEAETATDAVETIADVKVGAEEITGDSLRLLVGQKVEKNRDPIKAKLTEFGASGLPNFLATGDQTKFAEFKTFLENL